MFILEYKDAELKKYILDVYGLKVYMILEQFDKLYDKMTDSEKKEFLHEFIECIEIYPDKNATERIIKQIHFRFPVYYNGQEGDIMRLLNKNDVETVVLMSRVLK